MGPLPIFSLASKLQGKGKDRPTEEDGVLHLCAQMTVLTVHESIDEEDFHQKRC